MHDATDAQPDRPGFRYYRCSVRHESGRVLNGLTEPSANQTLRGDGGGSFDALQDVRVVHVLDPREA